MLKSFAKVYTCKHSSCSEVSFNRSVPMLVTSLIDFEGKQVSSSSFKFDIPSERFKGLKGSDFSLENQVAVGFNGKPCFYSPSLHSIESQIESSLNHE